MIARYLLVWLLLAVVGIANGIVRESTYGKVLSDLAAHQLSTVTAILASGVTVWLVHRVWPIETAAQAWLIGGLWLAATIIFEFGFGHYIVGHTWQRLFADYNLFAGRVWGLFLLWVLVMPYAIFTLANSNG
jgi:hypothetical protein